MWFAGQPQPGSVETLRYERRSLQPKQVARLHISRLPPGTHQRTVGQLLLRVERTSVYPRVLFGSTPDPVDKVTAIRKKLGVPMHNFLTLGIEPGCRRLHSTASRD